MNFGILAQYDEQGAAFHQVGDEPAADLLTEAGDETVRVFFLGRLYYRADLRRRLHPEQRPQPDAPAAEYALAAYRQAGVDGLSWLEGDYAFILWDARRQRLLASRDPMGGFPLYWIRTDNAVVVCTAMRPLVDMLPRRAINREYLAEFLMLPGTGVQELHHEACSYEGVHRVLAGTRIEVSPGASVAVTRWWDWLAQVESPQSLEHDAIAERFGVLLEEAIRERRVGRTAAHLSGGMDSTAVALLAARAAHAAGDEPVHGLSTVYERYSVLARERPFIESALGRPGLVGHLLPGDDHLGFDGYREQTASDEPALVLYQSTTNQAMLEHAATIGARTLMTGMGADELVGQPPYHLHELVRRGRWLAAWRESARWARAGGCSRWRFLGPFALLGSLPSMWQGGLGCWWQGGQVPWEQQSEYTIGPWIRPEFARDYGLWDRACARMRRATHRCRPLAVSLTLERLDLNVGDALRWSLGVPRGVMTVHPFRDPRLVRYCLGWQGHIGSDPERQKPILADAVGDVLPAAIRDRRRKGHFNEIFFAGLARNLPVLERLVRTAPVDDLGIVDKAELLRCLRKAALGIGEIAQGVDRLNLTLGILKWIATQQDNRPSPSLQPLTRILQPD